MTALARPDLDTGALLRLAAVFDSEHPTHRMLLNLARVAQSRNTVSALLDLDMLRKKINRVSHPEAMTVIAAVPMPVPDADRDDLDPMVRRPTTPTTDPLSLVASGAVVVVMLHIRGHAGVGESGVPAGAD